MKFIPPRDPALPTARELGETAEWLEAQQQPSGELPWTSGGKMDPWDHVQAAMGLAVAGRLEAARAAYRYLASTQEPDGAWAAERVGGEITRESRESNHAAYLATGLWHLHTACPDPDFLAELWPTLERAIDWVVGMALPGGAIAWAQKRGKVWQAPLITGSSSIHGSLVCAERVARRLGHERPRWTRARRRLARAVRDDRAVFENTDLPEKPGRHSMDWYYPVLGGAMRGRLARERLQGVDYEDFVQQGVGCRCVRESPWYTVAETCELVLALASAGQHEHASEILSWNHWQRADGGGYWTGATHPDGEVFPFGEQTTWTAASVILAADAVAQDSATSSFFASLGGEDLDAAEVTRRELPVGPGYEQPTSPAE